MTEEERKKLISKRRKELREKEMLKSLQTDTDLQERQHAVREKRESNENPWVRKGVIFFGNLLVLYIAYYVIRYASRIFIGVGFSMLGIDMSGFRILFHSIIWAVAIYSTVTEKRVLDNLIERFF